jgi:hypothetical protein
MGCVELCRHRQRPPGYCLRARRGSGIERSGDGEVGRKVWWPHPIEECRSGHINGFAQTPRRRRQAVAHVTSLSFRVVTGVQSKTRRPVFSLLFTGTARLSAPRSETAHAPGQYWPIWRNETNWDNSSDFSGRHAGEARAPHCSSCRRAVATSHCLPNHPRRGIAHIRRKPARDVTRGGRQARELGPCW